MRVLSTCELVYAVCALMCKMNAMACAAPAASYCGELGALDVPVSPTSGSQSVFGSWVEVDSPKGQTHRCFNMKDRKMTFGTPLHRCTCGS